MPSPADRIAEIRDVVPTAWYEAPWIVDHDTAPDGSWLVLHKESREVLAAVPDFGFDLACFIADARAAVPWLLDQLADWEQRHTDLRAEIKRQHDVWDRTWQHKDAEIADLAGRAGEALAVLNELIADHPDPGSRALAAQDQLAQALLGKPRPAESEAR